MSVELIVYLRRSAMPSPEGWQTAILDAGFPVELDTDFDPETFSGFLPCKFRQAQSGFEYFTSPLSEEDRTDVGAPQGCDFAVTLVTRSDLREFACSVAAAGALAQASNGLLVDPQSGGFTDSGALQWAKNQFNEAECGYESS
jgi:hypothetical protein